MTQYRKEVDLLGEREVPADAYWGIHTLRAVENFNISKVTISDVPEFVRGMVMVKKAAALANGELGAIPKEIAEAIVKACDEVLVNGKCLDQFPSDIYQGGAGTSVNMNTNEVIANLALEILGHKKGEYKYLDPMDHVNASQSTNDAYPTGFHIAVYNSVIKLLEKVAYLQQGFENKAKEFEKVLKMGRTQLQDAVPMTVGQEFKAFAVLMAEEVKHLKAAAAHLLEVNMGATAIGTGLNTPQGYVPTVIKYLSQVTGLPCSGAENLIEATADCGDYVSVHGALKRTAVKLSKICNDLRLLSSGPRAGIKEINLPELQAGSSIMPAKVNPVVPEVVNQVCFKVIGNDLTVTFAAEAGQLQLNVMEPVLCQCIIESIVFLERAIDTLRTKCIEGITANREVCLNMVKHSIGIVTALNPHIGYKNSTKIAKEALETGKSVYNLVLEHGLLSKDKLDEILDPKNMLGV